LVLEDAAHAHGASLAGHPAGSLGHVASFSFQSSKNLTSGEGGIITTNDDALAAACRSIHNCGRVPDGIWYEHHVISGNYRLGEFQGAMLNAQMTRLAAQTERRDANGQYLAERLSRLPGVHPQRRPAECKRHSRHLFMARINGALFGVPRDRVVEALRAEGIPCSGGYGYSLNQQPLFKNKAFGPYLPKLPKSVNYARQTFPNSDLICHEQGFWLDQSIFLGTQKDMDDIADAFELVHANRDALVGEKP
jgi:dTDP-4-amino-4,6-dideoxygalactose transaminase